MKKIFIILSTILCLSGFAQSKINIDADGNIMQNNTHQQNKLNNQQAALTTFSYSNVRALTEINDPLSADAYPWISPDGLRLYYTSGANNNQLMFTQRPNTTSNFIDPTLVPISTPSLSSCWLSNNELDVYVCTVSSLYFAHRNTVSSAFNTPVTINLTGAPSYTSIKGASLNFLQDVLFVTLFSTSNIIIEFSRTSSTSFAYVRTLSLPPGYEPRIGQLSKDELTFFFGAKYNNFDPLLSQLTRTATTLPFDVNTFQQIQGINDLNLSNNQPSMSNNLDWVVFVRNDTNLWTANNLYIAQGGTTICNAPNQPGAISGNTNVNTSSIETFSISPVAGATSYLWTLPAGYTGSSTTNTISITTGNTNGIISVVAQNSCGVSTARNLSVTVSNSGTVTPGVNFDWVWAQSTNNQNAGVYLYDMATDNLGNTYITGAFSSSTIHFGSITLSKISTNSNLFIAKYDANGNALWAKNTSLGGIGASECAIITDANNDVYVSGAYKNSVTFDGVTLSNPTGSSGTAMYIVKYTSIGILIWAKDVNYTSDVTVTGMSVDAQNNVFIAGDYSAADINFGGTLLPYYSNNNPFIVKYDVLGNVVWAKGTSQNNFGSIANFCYDVATDINGNSYITGNYMGNVNATLTFGSITLPSTNGGRNFYLTKYNSLGDEEWVKTSTGNSSNNSGREDIGRSIVTDSNGDIIVTGSFESTTLDFGSASLTNYTANNFNDIFVVKYNSLGIALWAKKAGGTNQEEGTGVAVDTNNAIYVSGYFYSKPVTFGSFVVNQIGSAPLNFVAKYDDLGNEIFVKHIEKTYSNSASYPACVTCDINGNVFLSGKAYDDAAFGTVTLLSGGIFVAKLGSTQVGINEKTKSQQSLLVYPNPSTGIFQIKNNIQPHTSFKLYNTSGQLIVQSNEPASEIDISNQPKGIYFLQLILEDKVVTRKIVLE